LTLGEACSHHELQVVRIHATEFVSFQIQQDLYQVTWTLPTARLVAASTSIVIPNNNLVKTLAFMIDHTGAVSGSIVGTVSFSLGRVT